MSFPIYLERSVPLTLRSKFLYIQMLTIKRHCAKLKLSKEGKVSTAFNCVYLIFCLCRIYSPVYTKGVFKVDGK